MDLTPAEIAKNIDYDNPFHKSSIVLQDDSKKKIFIKQQIRIMQHVPAKQISLVNESV